MSASWRNPYLVAAMLAGGLLLTGGIAFYLGAGPFGPRTPAESVGASDEQMPDPETRRAVRARCSGCHDAGRGFVGSPGHFLNDRADLSRSEWARRARVARSCGGCHAVPRPSTIPRRWWPDVMTRMREIVDIYRRDPGASPVSNPPRLNRSEAYDLRHYFQVFSRSREEMELPPDPELSARRFADRPLGRTPESDTVRPRIAHVQTVDMDRDGATDVLVSDFRAHAVSWIHRSDPDSAWTEEALVDVEFPARVEVNDLNDDGRLDLLVPDLGSARPTDRRVGRLYEAINRGDMRFERRLVVDGLGRVADVRAEDLDGDGDTDYVLGVFGFLTSGSIVWLERTDEGFTYHRLSEVEGAIHVPVTDLDGDGQLDVVALVSQQTEQVVAFLNRGADGFERRVLFDAGTPTFGSSGIELVDLDRDGDLDVLCSNGDAYDVQAALPLPSHGVQWLENVGDLEFEPHRILRMYGTYRANAADFDEDGDLDVVAVSLRNRWSDPDRKSIVWLENDGDESFTAHGVDAAPNFIATSDVADLTGDGRTDVVTGHLHRPYTGSEVAARLQRIGRVTLWENVGP